MIRNEPRRSGVLQERHRVLRPVDASWSRIRSLLQQQTEFMKTACLIGLAIVIGAACNRMPEAVVARAEAEHPLIDRIVGQPGIAWRVETTEHFIVRGIAGSFAGNNLASLSAAAEDARKTVLRRLGADEGSGHGTIYLFFVRHPDDIRMLVGQAAGGWTEPDANAVFAAVADSAPPALRHELGHLYSHRLWGYPSATWLSEGVAVFAAGHCRGIALHGWAAALLRSGDDSSLAALEREFDFSRAAPHLLAGSFITFLAEEYGLGAVEILWRNGLGAAQRATGASVAGLEAEWHARLRGVDVPHDMPEFRGRVRCETGTSPLDGLQRISGAVAGTQSGSP
jgi:hypothetical protein